jgi:hypothetical protein
MSRHSGKAKKWPGVAAGKSMGGIATERTKAEVKDYTGLTDYFLVDLAEGVVHFPQGADCGLLTIAIQHARHHQHRVVRLSGLTAYIQTQNLVQLCGVPPTQQGSLLAADQAALSRHFSPPEQPRTVLQAWWSNGGYHH